MPATFSTGKLSLGETVFAIGGKTTYRVGNGIVTSIAGDDKPTLFDTNIATNSILPGSPLVDLDGSIVGLSTGAARYTSSTGFTPASALTADPKPADKPADKSADKPPAAAAN
jgi:hypothetical protein